MLRPSPIEAFDLALPTDKPLLPQYGTVHHESGGRRVSQSVPGVSGVADVRGNATANTVAPRECRAVHTRHFLEEEVGHAGRSHQHRAEEENPLNRGDERVLHVQEGHLRGLRSCLGQAELLLQLRQDLGQLQRVLEGRDLLGRRPGGYPLREVAAEAPEHDRGEDRGADGAADLTEELRRRRPSVPRSGSPPCCACGRDRRPTPPMTIFCEEPPRPSCPLLILTDDRRPATGDRRPFARPLTSTSSHRGRARAVRPGRPGAARVSSRGAAAASPRPAHPRRPARTRPRRARSACRASA